MRTRSTFSFLCLVLFCSPVSAQKKIELTSPNDNIAFSFHLENKTAMYSVRFKGKIIVDDSSLGLVLDDNLLQKNLILKKPILKDTTENYDLVVGKTSHVNTHYKEVVLPLEENIAPFRKINLVVRVFDDGLGFRYEFPKQNNKTDFILNDEQTTFNIVGNPTVHTMFFPNYVCSHENYYFSLQLSAIKQDTLMDMPTLFDFDGKVYMAITEAGLLDYAGMYLAKQGEVLISKLSPLPNRPNIKVKAKFPHVSPWRVMLISDRIGDLIESNIITSLNAPCKIKDVTWIKPGKSTFPWWNGNVLPDTINAPGNNFVTAKYYIDFCARNNIEYHSVVEYGLHQWYVDDGAGFMPGPHSDVTKAVPGLDMKEICDYAKTKGVDIRVWVHWAALYPKLDSAFAQFEKWGLKGMMVDFMDRDDQEMVNIQTEILEKAAQHHLHIQFHGAYKPTGLHRTYPNEFTREGTLNYETNKWTNTGLPPEHDINMPFTRVLAGATDYHLGGFRAVPKNKFQQQYTRPLMAGTRCHQLGMYIVLESYLQMVCDYPEAYEGQSGFEFISQLPTTWDETKVLDAKAFQYICTARRKNNDWYIGIITDQNERNLTLNFSFLGEGNYTAEIYTDASDTDIHPNNLEKTVKSISKNDVLNLKIAGGGGAVLRLKKL